MRKWLVDHPSISILSSVAAILTIWGAISEDLRSVVRDNPLAAALGLALVACISLTLWGFKWRRKANTATSENSSANQSLSPRDCDLLDKFRDDLPYKRDIHFLNEHSFGAGFSWHSLARLADFVHDWGRDVHYEFNDPELERLRMGLHAAAEEFLHELSMNTFIESGSYSTDRWARVSDALELRDRAAWEALVARLDALADEVATAYKELVREGGRLRT